MKSYLIIMDGTMDARCVRIVDCLIRRGSLSRLALIDNCGSHFVSACEDDSSMDVEAFDQCLNELLVARYIKFDSKYHINYSRIAGMEPFTLSGFLKYYLDNASATMVNRRHGPPAMCVSASDADIRRMWRSYIRSITSDKNILNEFDDYIAYEFLKDTRLIKSRKLEVSYLRMIYDICLFIDTDLGQILFDHTDVHRISDDGRMKDPEECPGCAVRFDENGNLENPFNYLLERILVHREILMERIERYLVKKYGRCIFEVEVYSDFVSSFFYYTGWLPTISAEEMLVNSGSTQEDLNSIRNRLLNLDSQ